LMPEEFHAAVEACSRVQRNPVPSTHMRCMITANFLIPRRLAICIALRVVVMRERCSPLHLADDRIQRAVCVLR
jgi:hypothetical protein